MDSFAWFARLDSFDVTISTEPYFNPTFVKTKSIFIIIFCTAEEDLTMMFTDFEKLSKPRKIHSRWLNWATAILGNFITILAKISWNGTITPSHQLIYQSELELSPFWCLGMNYTQILALCARPEWKSKLLFYDFMGPIDWSIHLENTRIAALIKKEGKEQ